MARSFRYQRTFRVTAAEQRPKAESHVAWRVRVANLWGRTSKTRVVLRPYFEEGWLAVVKAKDWKRSPLRRELERLRRLLNEDIDDGAARDVRRKLGALFEGNFSSGNITIPSEIVWVLRQIESSRDLTVVDAGPYLEIWPTILWRRRMLGLPAKPTALSRRPAETPAQHQRG